MSASTEVQLLCDELLRGLAVRLDGLRVNAEEFVRVLPRFCDAWGALRFDTAAEVLSGAGTCDFEFAVKLDVETAEPGTSTAETASVRGFHTVCVPPLLLLCYAESAYYSLNYLQGSSSSVPAVTNNSGRATINGVGSGIERSITLQLMYVQAQRDLKEVIDLLGKAISAADQRASRAASSLGGGLGTRAKGRGVQGASVAFRRLREALREIASICRSRHGLVSEYSRFAANTHVGEHGPASSSSSKSGSTSCVSGNHRTAQIGAFGAVGVGSATGSGSRLVMAASPPLAQSSSSPDIDSATHLRRPVVIRYGAIARRLRRLERIGHSDRQHGDRRKDDGQNTASVHPSQWLQRVRAQLSFELAALRTGCEAQSALGRGDVFDAMLSVVSMRRAITAWLEHARAGADVPPSAVPPILSSDNRESVDVTKNALESNTASLHETTPAGVQRMLLPSSSTSPPTSPLRVSGGATVTAAKKGSDTASLPSSQSKPAFCEADVEQLARDSLSNISLPFSALRWRAVATRLGQYHSLLGSQNMRRIGAGSSAAISTAALSTRPSSFAHEERYYERQRQRHMRAQIEADTSRHSKEFSDDSRGSNDTGSRRVSSKTGMDIDNAGSAPLFAEASDSQPSLEQRSELVRGRTKANMDANKLLKSPFPSSSRRGSPAARIRERQLARAREREIDQPVLRNNALGSTGVRLSSSAVAVQASLMSDGTGLRESDVTASTPPSSGFSLMRLIKKAFRKDPEGGDSDGAHLRSSAAHRPSAGSSDLVCARSTTEGRSSWPTHGFLQRRSDNLSVDSSTDLDDDDTDTFAISNFNCRAFLFDWLCLYFQLLSSKVTLLGWHRLHHEESKLWRAKQVGPDNVAIWPNNLNECEIQSSSATIAGGISFRRRAQAGGVDLVEKVCAFVNKVAKAARARHSHRSNRTICPDHTEITACEVRVLAEEMPLVPSARTGVNALARNPVMRSCVVKEDNAAAAAAFTPSGAYTVADKAVSAAKIKARGLRDVRHGTDTKHYNGSKADGNRSSSTSGKVSAAAAAAAAAVVATAAATEATVLVVAVTAAIGEEAAEGGSKATGTAAVRGSGRTGEASAAANTMAGKERGTSRERMAITPVEKGATAPVGGTLVTGVNRGGATCERSGIARTAGKTGKAAVSAEGEIVVVAAAATASKLAVAITTAAGGGVGATGEGGDGGGEGFGDDDDGGNGDSGDAFGERATKITGERVAAADRQGNRRKEGMATAREGLAAGGGAVAELVAVTAEEGAAGDKFAKSIEVSLATEGAAVEGKRATLKAAAPAGDSAMTTGRTKEGEEPKRMKPGEGKEAAAVTAEQGRAATLAAGAAGAAELAAGAAAPLEARAAAPVLAPPLSATATAATAAAAAAAVAATAAVAASAAAVAAAGSSKRAPRVAVTVVLDAQTAAAEHEAQLRADAEEEASASSEILRGSSSARRMASNKAAFLSSGAPKTLSGSTSTAYLRQQKGRLFAERGFRCPATLSPAARPGQQRSQGLANSYWSGTGSGSGIGRFSVSRSAFDSDEASDEDNHAKGDEHQFMRGSDEEDMGNMGSAGKLKYWRPLFFHVSDELDTHCQSNDAISDVPSSGVHGSARAMKARHWGNIVSLLVDESFLPPREHGLRVPHAHFDDSAIDTTYFFCRVEPLLTLVVVIEEKRAADDAVVLEFLEDMCFELRNTKLFTQLCSFGSGARPNA